MRLASNGADLLLARASLAELRWRLDLYHLPGDDSPFSASPLPAPVRHSPVLYRRSPRRQLCFCTKYCLFLHARLQMHARQQALGDHRGPLRQSPRHAPGPCRGRRRHGYPDPDPALACHMGFTGLTSPQAGLDQHLCCRGSVSISILSPLS